MPYESGSPTVISQVAKAAFGTSPIGHVGFVLVQVATALILYTGANTPFTGFPFLANFIAEDSFLPRQLTRRGHRLAFSNGIIVLTVTALVAAARRWARTSTSSCRSTRSACSPGSRWPASGWPSTTAPTARTGMADEGSRSTSPAGVVSAARRAHLRGGEVHRGCLAGRHPLPALGGSP